MKDFIKQQYWIVSILLPIGIFLYAFPDYIIKHTFFWVCLITLPISIIRQPKSKFPFFICCLGLALVSALLPTTIGIYVYVCSMTLFIAQHKLGGIHVVGLVHAFLASPFFTYISNLVSFPIRIQLSKVVSRILTATGFENEVLGNVIVINGHEFLVDQACSGMYLLGYGILFGTIILSLRIRMQSISTAALIRYYGLLLILIIWGNIVRIYILVVGSIEADHWMHEAIGLLLFALQILIPFYFIVNRKPAKLVSAELTKQTVFPRIQYLTLTAILIVMVFVVSNRNQPSDDFQSATFPGFEVDRPSTEVIKLTNNESLIYIKKPVAAYNADHNPLICWSGSGYSFKQVDNLTLGDKVINIATLKKGEDVLYTSWWFESVQSQTSNQWDWRWRSFKKGEQFYLVNTTCKTKEELKKQVTNLLRESIISQNFIASNHDK